MYLPRMIYKAGELSVKKANQCIVSTLDELMAKIDEGFLPLSCKSVDNLGDIPELKAMMDKAEARKRLDSRTDEIVKKVTEMVKEDDVSVPEYHPESVSDVKIVSDIDLHQEYIKETSKPALYQGKETNKFKAWKRSK